MTIPRYDNLTLRITSPLVAGGGGGSWATGSVLETLVGETVSIDCGSISPPYMTFDRRPAGSSAAFSSGSFVADVPGLFIAVATAPRITDPGTGLVMAPDTTKVARVYVLAWPATQLSHVAIRYFTKGAFAAKFIVNQVGQTIVQGDQRPAAAQRMVLRTLSNDDATRDMVVARLEANSAISPADALASISLTPFETTAP